MGDDRGVAQASPSEAEEVWGTEEGGGVFQGISPLLESSVVIQRGVRFELGPKDFPVSG